VRAIAEQIYAVLRISGTFPVDFPRAFYAEYQRPLALLEGQLYIIGTHTIGVRFFDGIWSNGPAFVLYMCGLFEDPARMNKLLEIVDTAKPGSWLKGDDIAAELILPVAVVRAVFETFHARGLGLLSEEVGVTHYLARA
jgi:hypothetical protein